VTVTGGSVWIHCDLVNIRTALAELFKVAHRSYMIKSDVVSDTVECSLNGVSFDLALQTILASVTQPLTFKVESGVYTIMPKSSPTTGLGGGSD